MSSNKVKLLNNYQLYQMAHNHLLDNETLAKVRHELYSRNISTIEQKLLEQQYRAALAESNEQLEASSWHPFYTAFAWKRHFKHIGLLKSFNRKNEAKTYELKFYAGILAYALLFVLALLIFRIR